MADSFWCNDMENFFLYEALLLAPSLIKNNRDEREVM